MEHGRYRIIIIIIIIIIINKLCVKQLDFVYMRAFSKLHIVVIIESVWFSMFNSHVSLHSDRIMTNNLMKFQMPTYNAVRSRVYIIRLFVSVNIAVQIVRSIIMQYCYNKHVFNCCLPI